jgi:histidine triad (HIT) family protein
MSLTGPYDEQNVFARILRGEIPAARVWENDRVLVFMDVFPQSEGHALIISKVSKARNLLEVEAGVLAELAETARRVARAAAVALQADGVSILQFNGEAGGQTVFHLHLHVVPRWADRPMKGHGHAPMADPDALKATAARIAAAMD